VRRAENQGSQYPRGIFEILWGPAFAAALLLRLALEALARFLEVLWR
jgi:hypothetical protein